MAESVWVSCLKGVCVVWRMCPWEVHNRLEYLRVIGHHVIRKRKYFYLERTGENANNYMLNNSVKEKQKFIVLFL